MINKYVIVFKLFPTQMALIFSHGLVFFITIHISFFNFIFDGFYYFLMFILTKIVTTWSECTHLSRFVKKHTAYFFIRTILVVVEEVTVFNL